MEAKTARESGPSSRALHAAFPSMACERRPWFLVLLAFGPCGETFVNVQGGHHPARTAPGLADQARAATSCVHDPLA